MKQAPRRRLATGELPLASYEAGFDGDGSSTKVSSSFEALFGYPAEEYVSLGDFWSRRVVEADLPRLRAAFDALRETGEVMSVEYRVTASDGREVCVRDLAVIVEEDDGGPVQVRGFLTDVSREKELERQLAGERAQTEAFFRDATVGLAISDADGRYLRVNDALARMGDRPASEYVGRSLAEMAPDAADQVGRLMERVHRTGEAVYQQEIEYEIGGAPGFALLSYFPIEGGDELQYGRVVIDTTAWRQAERERAAAQEQYRRLIEQLPLVTYVNSLDPAFRTDFVSPQIEQFGYPLEAFLGDSDLWDSLVHPDDREAVRLGEQMARESGEPFALEYRVIRADGSVAWVLDLMERVVGTDGEQLVEQGFVVDVTDRKRSEALFRAVFDKAFEAIVVTDDDGRYVDVNPAACELFGRSRGELLGLRPGALSGAEDEQDGRRLVTDGSIGGSHIVVRPDGQVRETEFAAKANVLPGRHVSVLRDVTARRELERELWRSQRLESVGRLAGGVAHDFNNMLTAIRGYAELLLARTEPGSVEHHHAKEIDDAAGKAATLTAQLLAFGRGQLLKARPVELNRLVEGVADVLKELGGDGVELELALEAGLGFVSVDPAQLEQLLVNLVANAVDAVEGAGRIGVRTASVDVGEGDVRADLPAGRYAVLSVEDSGRGIDTATLEHLFEPFFTTKAFGRGAGLGLATAYGIAKQSEGTITVSTVSGAGSTFSVYLPTLE